MTSNRELLVQELLSGRERSREAGLEIWNEHAERLRAAVVDEDRYWLEDRIQDMECELGFAPHPSHISHLLSSQGLAYLGDENPLPGPHPYFLLLTTSMVAGRDAVPPDRGNGGFGLSTWGYVLLTETAWFAHAAPGAGNEEIQQGLKRMRDDLAELGISVSEPTA